MGLKLDKKMKPLAGMWSKQSSDGNHYLSGGNKTHKFCLFFNPDAKEGEPDWTLHSEQKPGPKANKAAQPAANFLEVVKSQAKPDEELNDSLDDLWKPLGDDAC